MVSIELQGDHGRTNVKYVAPIDQVGRVTSKDHCTFPSFVEIIIEIDGISTMCVEKL
jgi:hypothetical protein